MLPTFAPGQLVVFTLTRDVRVGDVVMVLHNETEKIKRIARLEAGRMYVLGDNPAASTDSRTFGWIGVETVIGKAVWPRNAVRDV